MPSEITNPNELYSTLLGVLDEPGVTDIRFRPRTLQFEFHGDVSKLIEVALNWSLKHASDYMDSAMEHIPEFYRYSLDFDSDIRKLYMDLCDTDVFRYEFGFSHNEILSSHHWYYFKDLRTKIDATDCRDNEPMNTLFNIVLDRFNKVPIIRLDHIELIATGLSRSGFKVEPSSKYQSVINIVV